MATKIRRPSGAAAIQFTDLSGRRRTLSLGRVDDLILEECFQAVDDLVLAAKHKTETSHRTRAFLNKLTDEVHQKFAEAELVIPRRARTVVPFTQFAREYKARRSDLTPGTLLVVGHVVANIESYFQSKPIDEVTAADAEEFSRWLRTEARARRVAGKQKGLSPQTYGKRLKWAATICADAVRMGLIGSNPFSSVKKPGAVNHDRRQYVPREVIERLIDLEPDREWRALLAMCRFLGVRCPSECFGLKWGHIDWQARRLTIPSPKTAHQGKACRMAPLVPGLYEALDDLWQTAPDGEYILARLRDRDSMQEARKGYWRAVNLRSQLLKKLRKHGIQPWPRLFHGMRASAETDLAAQFPLASVAMWLGNSPAVAAIHYLTPRDGDLDRASKPRCDSRCNPEGNEGEQRGQAQEKSRENTSFPAESSSENDPKGV